MDAFSAQKSLFLDRDDLIIFDVGACVGDVSLIYRGLFPNSKIYAFEPYGKAFNDLIFKTKEKNIEAINVALGKEDGLASFNINAAFPTNSFLDSHEDGNRVWDDAGMLTTIDKQMVEVLTIDVFVQSRGIERIDILKMDTQGTEYDVILGAVNFIKDDKIKMVYTEIITMPTYIGQRHLDEVLKLFRENNFSLYNIYGQSYTKDKKLRQVDALFIHDSFYKG